MCVMVEEHLDHRAGAELGSRCLDKLRVAIAQRKLSNKSRLYLRLDDFSLPVMGLGYFLPERPGDFWLEDYVVVANKAEGDCLFEALSYLGGDVRLADRLRQGVCDVLLTMGSEVPPSSDAASAILDSVREQCLVAEATGVCVQPWRWLRPPKKTWTGGKHWRTQLGAGAVPPGTYCQTPQCHLVKRPRLRGLPD